MAVVALNDEIADGRDVSWIWDVDFEPLIPALDRLVASGSRAEELALRFKYGGFDGRGSRSCESSSRRSIAASNCARRCGARRAADVHRDAGAARRRGAPGARPAVLGLGSRVRRPGARGGLMSVPRTAEVVVVGGGIMGASALYHLARAGCRAAVLVERETLGSGSTSKAAGGIRAQFSDELNVRDRARVHPPVRALRRGAGRRDRLQAVGLSLPPRPRPRRSSLVRALARGPAGARRALRALDRDEAAEIVPELDVDDSSAATFCPIDGYATPEAAVQGYAAAAAAPRSRDRPGLPGDADRGGRRPRRRGRDRRGTIATGSVILAAGRLVGGARGAQPVSTSR